MLYSELMGSEAYPAELVRAISTLQESMDECLITLRDGATAQDRFLRATLTSRTNA